MMQMLLVIVLLVMLPFILFFGVVGLAIFIWCWNRIGRYLINFGRWLGSWRNFIPLSILGILSLILILVVLPIIGFSRTPLLVVLVLFFVVTIVIFMFALVAWIVRFCQWFWPPYRKFVWSTVSSMWGALPQGRGRGRRRVSKPSSGPTPDGQPPAGKQQPSKRSWLGSFWALMLGKPPQPAKSPALAEAGPQANVQPPRKAPAKRSWFGSFWALMLGKPSKPAKPKSKPKPVTVQTTEQKSGPSDSVAATTKTGASTSVTETSTVSGAGKKASAKRSWLGAFWALMLGKPSKAPESKTESKPKPARVDTTEQTFGPSGSVAATAKTGATAHVAEAATTPERAKKEKLAKRGFFAGMWTSIVRGVTFVVGLVFLGAVWVVQKIREGIEWMRIRLNLD